MSRRAYFSFKRLFLALRGAFFKDEQDPRRGKGSGQRN